MRNLEGYQLIELNFFILKHGKLFQIKCGFIFTNWVLSFLFIYIYVSEFIGINWVNGCWETCLQTDDGKTIRAGTYKDELKAAQALNTICVEEYGLDPPNPQAGYVSQKVMLFFLLNICSVSCKKKHNTNCLSD